MDVMHVDVVVVMVNVHHAQRYAASFVLVSSLVSLFKLHLASKFLFEIYRFVEKDSVAGIINASLLVTSMFFSSLLWFFVHLVSNLGQTL